MVEYVTSHYSEWEDSIDIKSNIDILWPRTYIIEIFPFENQPVFWIIQLLIESNFGNCLCKLFQLFMANIPHCSSHWTSPVVNWLLFYYVNLVKKKSFLLSTKVFTNIYNTTISSEEGDGGMVVDITEIFSVPKVWLSEWHCVLTGWPWGVRAWVALSNWKNKTKKIGKVGFNRGLKDKTNNRLNQNTYQPTLIYKFLIPTFQFTFQF